MFRGRNVDARTDESSFWPPTSTKNQVCSTIYSKQREQNAPSIKLAVGATLGRSLEERRPLKCSYPFMVSTRVFSVCGHCQKWECATGANPIPSWIVGRSHFVGLITTCFQTRRMAHRHTNELVVSYENAETADVPFDVLCSFARCA